MRLVLVYVLRMSLKEQNGWERIHLNLPADLVALCTRVLKSRHSNAIIKNEPGPRKTTSKIMRVALRRGLADMLNDIKIKEGVEKHGKKKTDAL